MKSFRIFLYSIVFVHLYGLSVCLGHFDHVKRALVPSNPGDGGHGAGHGHVPFTGTNQHQNSIQNQVIRVREPVDRPPELPAGHPIRPHQPEPNRQEENGIFQRIMGKKDKGKAYDHEASTSGHSSKKRKVIGDEHDEAGPSGTKIDESLPKKQKTFEQEYRSARTKYEMNHSIGKLATEAIFIGAPVAFHGGRELYRASRETVQNAARKVKETCDSACRRARELRDRILRRPQTVPEQLQPHQPHQQHRHPPSPQSTDYQPINRERDRDIVLPHDRRGSTWNIRPRTQQIVHHDDHPQIQQAVNLPHQAAPAISTSSIKQSGPSISSNKSNNSSKSSNQSTSGKMTTSSGQYSINRQGSDVSLNSSSSVSSHKRSRSGPPPSH